MLRLRVHHLLNQRHLVPYSFGRKQAAIRTRSQALNLAGPARRSNRQPEIMLKA